MSAFIHFNPARLIDEVKTRPGLYGNSTDKICRLERLTLWKDVGAAIFEDWGQLNKTMVYGRVLQIQKKWKSLRDGYNRELRLRKSGDKRTRIVYRYFKRMSFLGGYEGNVSSEEEESTGGKDFNFGIEDDNPTPNMKVEKTSDEEVVLPKLKKIKKKRRKRKLEPKPIEIIEPEEDMDMSELPIEFNENDTDSDKLFLLSFLPEMRALPVHLKMWTRSQIANIMQEAVTSHYNNTDPDLKKYKRNCMDLTDNVIIS